MEQSPFRTRLHLRWSDIDANFHLRHSVYYDLCAQQRMDALGAVGITMHRMKEQHFGPILFREECIFRKEIGLHDEVFVDLALSALDHGKGRFSFSHTFSKADGTHCALLTVDGAWMDTKARKLIPSPPMLSAALDSIPRLP